MILERMKIRNIHIDDYKVFRNFNLDLTANGQTQNLIVLAGINGSGKTTLLRECIYNFIVDKKTNVGVAITFDYFDKKANEYRLLDIDGNFLYKKDNNNASGSIDVEYPYVYFYEAGQSNQKSAEDVILKFVDMLIYQQDKKSSEAYSEVQKLLGELFLDFDLQIEFMGIDQDRKIFFKNKNNDKIPIEELSSGEQELITKSFSLYLVDIRNSIILVDEPEGSMHPNWQNRIATVYQQIADKNNNQVLLATHSPHIVASVKKDQIRVLIKDQNNIKAIQDFSGSYGWRIDRVLLDIFRVASLRTPLIENELQLLKKLVFDDKFISDEYNKKLSYLETILGYEDIDLTMLRFEVMKRKKQNEKNK